MEVIMNKALRKTEGNARIRIWIDCFLKMYQSALKALSKINGGKKINKMLWGFIFDTATIDYPRIPKSGEKYPSKILIKKRVGV